MLLGGVFVAGNFSGTDEDDVLIGSDLEDEINGKRGNDIIAGQAGDDGGVGMVMTPCLAGPEPIFSGEIRAMIRSKTSADVETTCMDEVETTISIQAGSLINCVEAMVTML